jgi:hypothetical protein
MVCIVLRAFPGANGVRYTQGQEVNTSDWLHTERLINQRYLQPKVLAPVKAEREKVEKGPPPRPSKTQRTGLR